MSFFFVPRRVSRPGFVPAASFARTRSFFFSVLSFFRSFVRSTDNEEFLTQVVHAYSKYEELIQKEAAAYESECARAGNIVLIIEAHRPLLAALLAGVVVLDESHTTDRFNYSDIKSSCLYHLTVEWKFLIYRPGMPPLDRLFT